MRKLKGKQVLAAVFAAVLGTSLMGCSLCAGSASGSNVVESGTTLSTIGAQEITPTPTPDPNEGLLVIGTKASGKHVYKVRFDNETGKTITAFQIRDESEDDFEPDLLQGNEFPSGSKVLCYYDAGDAFKAMKSASSSESEESTESAAVGQTAVNAAEDIPDFYIQLTFSDGQVAVLHDVPFSEFEEAMICTDAGTYYYLTYETPDGTSVTTMKSEQKIKEQADEEAAAAKKKAEEEAAESEAAAKRAAEKAAAQSAAAQQKQEEEAAARKQAEEEAAAQSAAAAAAAQQQAEEAAAAAAQSVAQTAQNAQNNAQDNTQNTTQDNTQQNQTDNGGTVGTADGSGSTSN